jgi:pimeloyl-ACP methyl ester carboxylesterase
MDVPVRFVWGDGDPVLTIEDHCERMRQRLPRGSQYDVVAIAGGRHFIQEFAEEEIAEACVQVAEEAFA